VLGFSGMRMNGTGGTGRWYLSLLWVGMQECFKFYFPEGYDVDPLFNVFRRYINYCTHHKWMNNHDYYARSFCWIKFLQWIMVLCFWLGNKRSLPRLLFFTLNSINSLDELIDQLSLQEDESRLQFVKRIPLSSAGQGSTVTGIIRLCRRDRYMQFCLNLQK